MQAVQPLVLVVMGVSGSGKSTVGALLASALGLEFVEGDSLHSAYNIARMASGTALTDQDRQHWLELLSGLPAQARRDGRGLVVSCSALRRNYRDTLRRGASDLFLVHLTGAPALLATRTAQRRDHYMPTSLLASQFATLELPDADEAALDFDATLSPGAIVDAVRAALLKVRGERALRQ